MKKFGKLLKISLTLALCLGLCIPFAVSALASSAVPGKPAASQVSAVPFPIPASAIVDDLTKKPVERAPAGKPRAVQVPAKKGILPSGVKYDILKGKPQGRCHMEFWNWCSGAYCGEIQNMSGDLPTNYCFATSGSGKLLVNTDFRCDAGKKGGYAYRITCYNCDSGQTVASWEGQTGPASGSSPHIGEFQQPGYLPHLLFSV